MIMEKENAYPANLSAAQVSSQVPSAKAPAESDAGIDLLQLYRRDERVGRLVQWLAPAHTAQQPSKIALRNLLGSAKSVIAAATASQLSGNQLFVLADKEQAAYFCNDLEKLTGQGGLEQARKRILYFPASYKKPYESEEIDNANVLSRTEVLNRLSAPCDQPGAPLWIVTYPEALAEKVITTRFLSAHTVQLHKGEAVSQDFLIDFLEENQFEWVDFVAQPGQYALRGGIIDVFSFANDTPYRIEFDGDKVESIRSFEVGTQLSVARHDVISLLPNLQEKAEKKERISFLTYFSEKSVLWVEDMESLVATQKNAFERAEAAYAGLQGVVPRARPEELYLRPEEAIKHFDRAAVVEFGQRFHYACPDGEMTFAMRSQPVFNKKFEWLVRHLREAEDQGYQNFILSENPKQIQRLERIFFELSTPNPTVRFIPLKLSLNEGFIDDQARWEVFTDHQIFERYHRYTVQPRRQDSQALTLKELYQLKPGDYISHVDHGVGRFAGLEKVKVNGREQEAICLMYKDNDMLRMSIHALHKMSKYAGKEGEPPVLNRLGSNAWAVTKAKAKQKVKDIARELIRLYAQRKASQGFAFSPDSYLQHELESSFFYEDTPDQFKASEDVKRDMESTQPMDRLVCGDVGFGKTEVAIRAAFKAACDGKQVAVLVPTTILAYQHYKTFQERLGELPCSVDYINRFRTAKERKEILAKLKEGRLDILIGTHRILSKDVVFKDLGLLIIDEEQKFGVAMKEKLKSLKVNIDTLTLTATPIPRTLQFSLMGARDLSVIQTPPPNRYPVHTEIHAFDEEFIRDVMVYELSRGGQVFFVHHRVQNIMEVAGMLQRLLPDAHIAVAHGQMEGDKLEEVLLGFMEGAYDILVSTKIVENGLDISNANTIIVNEAHQYGLSELHQLRGRVGRSNKKAFCYMMAPPEHLLTPEAKRRLRAIEEFSEIGGGFQVAMRDLDIRGAGNILGGEQSGFIAEMGFEMYQRILDEAIDELRQEQMSGAVRRPDFSAGVSGAASGAAAGASDISATSTSDAAPIPDPAVPIAKMDFTAADCQVETDLEILIPDDYVSSITERLALYKELDSLEKDSDLEAYAQRLRDRFGPIPEPTRELMRTVVLRRAAKRLGWSRILLKDNRLTAVFAAQDESLYYQSPLFSGILSYVQDHPAQCRLQENRQKLSVVFEQVPDVKSAIELCGKLSSAS